jgi:hypothetical protein
VRVLGVANGRKTNPQEWRFDAVRKSEIPRGREGKHKKIVDQLLAQVDQLAAGTALKVPLAEMPTTKANLRAALNRATHKQGVCVATSSDAHHLYLWKKSARS